MYFDEGENLWLALDRNGNIGYSSVGNSSVADPNETRDPPGPRTATQVPVNGTPTVVSELNGTLIQSRAEVQTAAESSFLHVVPGYQIIDLLGEGGMGVVYRAREIAFDRDVAIKLLHSRYQSDSPGTRRFLEEARITAQLQHPAIPPVHHIGTLADGRPFLAMKLIKGETLADLLTTEPANRGRYIAAFAQVCQALAYAHSRKVIHRDLKPSNVMVGAFGEVLVMDWGLAKVLTGEACTSSEPSSPLK
jgi:serine/threonine protein kinase